MKSLAHYGERSIRRARWMAAVQRGDADAYGALLDDIGPMIMRFLRRRLRDTEEAQDVYQDIFMTLHRIRHVYQPTRPLEPWLFAIAHRVFRAHQRRRLTRITRECPVETPPEIPVDSDSHVKLRLEEALRDLSSDQRLVIKLLKIDGLSTEMAARRAGTTTGALKVRAHRSYKVLRQLLL